MPKPEESLRKSELSTIGESTYERFRRLVDKFGDDDDKVKTFQSHIIAWYAERHDLELRDILQECYDDTVESFKPETESGKLAN